LQQAEWVRSSARGRLGWAGRHLHPLFRLATIPGLPKYAIAALFHPATRRPGNFVAGVLGEVTGDSCFHRPESHRKEFESLLEGLEDPAAQRAFLATLRSSSTIGGQAISALDRLSTAHIPVLVLWGRQDRVFPVEHAMTAAAALPNARLALLDRCGHFNSRQREGSPPSCSTGWRRPRRCGPIRDQMSPRSLIERGCRRERPAHR
jgi:pimeloyl-ACP methyl ester carboxylesterase